MDPPLMNCSRIAKEINEVFFFEDVNNVDRLSVILKKESGIRSVACIGSLRTYSVRNQRYDFPRVNISKINWS